MLDLVPGTAARLRGTRHSRRLDGKIAVVTGSTSGIGLGIARALAAEGAEIVLNGLGEPDEIGRTADDIARQHDVRVRYEPADLESPEAIRCMLHNVDHLQGGIDILVNNAGIQHVAALECFPPERWDAVLAVNLTAAFHTTRHVIPIMRRRGGGRIVNIASAHALVASPFKAAYVAAKHGLLGLTRTAALELAEFGITCNAVCPGYVWTPLVERQIDDQSRSHGIAREQVVRDVLLRNVPTKRFATIEEIGGTVAFLCGDAAASITGAAIAVDGGWTAH